MAFQSQDAAPAEAVPDRDYARAGLTMRHRSVLAALPRTEQNIVLALKLHGPTNIVELSERLKASASALRPHLGQLEDEGLVTHHATVKGPGRPQYTFSLTNDGDQLFPNAVGRFGIALVRFLADRNPALLRQFTADTQAAFLLSSAGDLQGLDYGDAVAAVVDALASVDYLPEAAETGDGIRVQLHHCPLLAIAREFPLLCEYEQATLEDMAPTARVTRTEHRLDGAPLCTYLFAERALLRRPEPFRPAAPAERERLVF
jgi:DeoR family suf operon transcriptional repressor